eukprot:COSAG02_NODE_2560_length_8525_cov_89.485348_5_plen_143_part_00
MDLRAASVDLRAGSRRVAGRRAGSHLVEARCHSAGPVGSHLAAARREDRALAAARREDRALAAARREDRAPAEPREASGARWSTHSQAEPTMSTAVPGRHSGNLLRALAGHLAVCPLDAANRGSLGPASKGKWGAAARAKRR